MKSASVKTFFFFILILTAVALSFNCNKHALDYTDYSSSDTGTVAHPDHIIFVWLENKGFDKIIGSSSAPYINSLIARGTLFTNTYALTHPSYPNYVAFFSGQVNGVNSDNCINASLLDKKNLFTELTDAGKTFAWYSEGLPETGSKVCKAGYYVEKHNPVTIFSNVPDSANKPFSLFPSDYNKLENVVCISPNLINDMHDGSIEQGDTWIKNNLSSLIDWCSTHNSIFVVYYDESETDADNRIPVIAIGKGVKQGFRSTIKYDHFSWTKTICRMFNADDDWTFNLKLSRRISDCWK
jgi:phosphatidylinositol-3-phosphatase